MSLRNLGGAVASCSGDNLEALVGKRPHKQGRENALAANAFGLLFRRPFCCRGRGEPPGNRRLPYVIGT
jgi:hypothetical protein